LLVDDPAFFNPTDIEKLKGIFGDRFLIREPRPDMKDWHLNAKHPLQANTVRFLERPNMMAEYTYIGDVDIILLDNNIVADHIIHTEILKLPYSNVKRNGIENLTGLHFVETQTYYETVTEDWQSEIISRLNVGSLNIFDENLLYHMMVEAFGVPEIDADPDTCRPDAEPGPEGPWLYKYRPQHGFHLSLNRPQPTHPQHGWGITEKRIEKYKAMDTQEQWLASKETFHPDYNELLSLLEKEVYNV